VNIDTIQLKIDIGWPSLFPQ